MIYTDRSRWKADCTCRRKRYLEYNYLGLGVRPRKQQIALATGTAVHAPLASLLEAQKASGDLIGREQAREIIQKAVGVYRASAAVGWLGEANEHAQYIVDEQACLLEGLFWCFWSELLPWLRDTFEILEVEQEDSHVFACDCGLGDGVGAAADHASRVGASGQPCASIALMLRPDFALRHRETGMAATADFKSSSYPLDRKQNEHAPQMALSGLGLERRLGEQIPHYWLFGLLKGKRDFASKAEREQQGSLKKQASLLCYAWYSPGGPGQAQGTWRTEYTREKGFGKVPIWEGWFPELPDGVSKAEYWTLDVLSKEERKAQLDILGPCDREVGILPSLLRQMGNREGEVAEALWKLQESPEQEVEILDLAFPQNWNACFEWNRECEYRGACLGREGTLEAMVVREPHHAPELEWAKAAGIVFEAQEGEELEQ